MLEMVKKSNCIELTLSREDIINAGFVYLDSSLNLEELLSLKKQLIQNNNALSTPTLEENYAHRETTILNEISEIEVNNETISERNKESSHFVIVFHLLEIAKLLMLTK